jgi:hypothetical protein
VKDQISILKRRQPIAHPRIKKITTTYHDNTMEAATKYFQDLAAPVNDPVAGTAAYKGHNDLAYALSKVPLRSARPLKIIVAGAGISGLSFAHEVQTGRVLKNINLTVYEKNAGVGGTWYENRYPGYVVP